MTRSAIDATPSDRSRAVATRIGFFMAGFAMAAWAPLIVFAKARTRLDDGHLGILLLGLGCGSAFAMPLAGAMASRFGCRAVIVAAALATCATLPGLATASEPAILAATLLGFRAAVGALDCVINVQAVAVEKAFGRPMMSGFHGLFSVGGIAGAGGVSLLLRTGASPLVATATAAVCILVALAAATPGLLTSAGRATGPVFALPRGVVLGIGALCFIAFLTEGAVLDWGAVLLVVDRGLAPADAGLGYALFACAMTAGRLSGDRIVRRWGSRRVTAVGGLMAAAGLAAAALVPGWAVAMAGFLIVGAGCSNIVPVLYTAVGRQAAMPERLAVPAISTMGYAGILSGPGLIGAAAHLTSLGTALLLVALLMVGVSASARMLR